MLTASEASPQDIPFKVGAALEGAVPRQVSAFGGKDAP